MEDKKEKYANSIVDDNKDWYAIRLYTVKQEDADTFFTENGIETFIPKQYVAEESKQGKVHNKLKTCCEEYYLCEENYGRSLF